MEIKIRIMTDSDLIPSNDASAPYLETRNGRVVFNVSVRADVEAEAEKAEYDEEFRRAFSPRR
jgi:hypothetical protein